MRYNTFKQYRQVATRMQGTVEPVPGGGGSISFERTHENVAIRGVHASGRTGMVRFWSQHWFPPEGTWWTNVRTAEGDIIFIQDDESLALEEGRVFQTFSVTPKLTPHGEVEEYEYIVRYSAELVPTDDGFEVEEI